MPFEVTQDTNLTPARNVKIKLLTKVGMMVSFLEQTCVLPKWHNSTSCFKPELHVSIVENAANISYMTEKQITQITKDDSWKQIQSKLEKSSWYFFFLAMCH